MKTRKQIGVPSLCVAFVLSLLWAGTATAETFHAASEFSQTSNPNGSWTYGYSPLSFSSFASYTAKYLPLSHIEGYESWSFGSTSLPLVEKNATTGTMVLPPSVDLLAGQLALHPGRSCEFSIVRWTAPSDGKAIINAEFSGRDYVGPTTSDARILQNGSSLFSEEVNGYGPEKGKSFSTVLTVLAGDTIDFAVGCGNNFNPSSDTTALQATISLIPHAKSVPTLTEWGMIVFSTCAGMIAVLYIRRRRNA